MDLKGKMDLYISYRYGKCMLDRTFTHEDKLKDFINEIIKDIHEDLENGCSGDFEIIEIINNLGY